MGMRTSSELKRRYMRCKSLHRQLKQYVSVPRRDFQQAEANAEYYRTMVVEEMWRLRQRGDRVVVDETDELRLMHELVEFEQDEVYCDYMSRCYHTLRDSSRVWDDAASTSLLFLVLPSDLNSWEDSDPSTHRFRLYFLCDNRKLQGAQKDMPQDIHLSNHPGYKITRTKEFFQNYGDYAVRMLHMVKYGFGDGEYMVPPLDTFKILWNCDPDVIGKHLTKDSIGPHVDKAILYLHGISPPKSGKDLGLAREQSIVIQTYLDVQDGHNIRCNLNRYIVSNERVLQKCHAHGYQYLHHGCLQELKKFVHSHRGHVDMKQAKLKVELRSMTEADQFQTRLSSVKHVFDISLTLNWKVTRAYMQGLCVNIASTGTVSLEIDGVNLDIHPQGFVGYTAHIFGNKLLENTGLRIITLLNYPQPRERCVYFPQLHLQSTHSQVQFPRRVADLYNYLQSYGTTLRNNSDLVGTAEARLKLHMAAGELLAALKENDFLDVTMVTFYGDSWNAVLDLEKGAFVEACSVNMDWATAFLSFGSLRTLTVDLSDLELNQNFLFLNTGLQELNASYRGQADFFGIEHIVKMWHDSSSSFSLTLVDRTQDTQGRVAARLAPKANISQLLVGGTPNTSRDDITSRLCHRRAVDISVDTVVLEWNCDHIYSQLSDYSASFLDVATRQHLSTVALLTLDVSGLSRSGLTSIRNAMQRWSLEHLHIMCVPVGATLSEPIIQILATVPWSILKSLVLSGSHVDEWIHLWKAPITNALNAFAASDSNPGLHFLQVLNSKLQPLSHSSVLFLHKLIYSSPLTSLRVENMQTLSLCDWGLMVEAIDYTLLETFALSERRVGQPKSAADMWDFLVAELVISAKNRMVWDMDMQ